MQAKISVVLNTYNEEGVLKRALEGLSWADEVLVCDMHSDDGSVSVAKKFGAKVIYHKKLEFVEPARNYAVSKATGDWILVMDPDEQIPSSLASQLRQIADNPTITTYVEIPRKNIIFNKWVKSSMWWPDYNIRFFKAGSVEWSTKIHIPPRTSGQGIKLPLEEGLAIAHYHYNSISQFLKRMDRYTSIQAKELDDDGYKFDWKDLIQKPLSEFLGRFFANKGYKDGLHGFALGLLQAFSFVIVYLKVWELQKFKEENISLSELKEYSKQSGKQLRYWFKYGNLSNSPIKAFLQKVINKIF